MKTKYALIMYAFGIAFGIMGYYDRTFLVAGYVLFGFAGLVLWLAGVDKN